MSAWHNENPEDLLTEKQTSSDVSEALTAAIAELDAEDRLILKLYYFDDLKLKDIAATFGYHEATASRKLTRIQTTCERALKNSFARGTAGPIASKTALINTAASLGINLETMFAVLTFAVLVQDFWTLIVL